MTGWVAMTNLVAMTIERSLTCTATPTHLYEAGAFYNDAVLLKQAG